MRRPEKYGPRIFAVEFRKPATSFSKGWNRKGAQDTDKISGQVKILWQIKLRNTTKNREIRKLKNSIAPGQKGILAEMLKERKEAMMQILRNISNVRLHR